VKLKFTPAVYINKSDAKAWRALATAMGKGALCRGAWVANYGKRTGAEGPPAWDPAQPAPKSPITAPCPILAWQYAGDYEDVLDFSIMPPDGSADATVQLMIPPPAGAPMAPAAAVALGNAIPQATQLVGGTFTVRHGKRYRATVTLSGFFETMASNDTIAAKLTAAGFTNVTVTGSGATRQAEGVWNGPDTTAQIDPHLSGIEMV
jgi:hypothetical protein